VRQPRADDAIASSPAQSWKQTVCGREEVAVGACDPDGSEPSLDQSHLPGVHALPAPKTGIMSTRDPAAKIVRAVRLDLAVVQRSWPVASAGLVRTQLADVLARFPRAPTPPIC